MLKRRKAAKMKVRESLVIKSPGHLAFVRGFQCAVFGRGRHECEGKIEAHHVISRGAGGGDEQVCPLCSKAHSEIHSMGADTFAAAYKVDLPKLANQLWRSSSHRLKWEKEHVKVTP